jgi:hypothetical protein
MMKAICSSVTSVLTRTTRRKIPEGNIRHTHRHENLKSHVVMQVRRSCQVLSEQTSDSSASLMTLTCILKHVLTLNSVSHSSYFDLDCVAFGYRGFTVCDRLCGLVVRVPGCRPIGPGHDSRRYQIFLIVVGLKRGPLSRCEDK